MDSLLSGLLCSAAATRPEHPAVEDDRRALSYRALADRAGRLAAELSARSISAGDRVGILMPKSTDAVVSLYGILAAGAAYVPLDTQVPAARLAYMIRNSKMKALITFAKEADRLGDGLAETSLETVLLLDADEASAGFCPAPGIGVVRSSEIARRAPLDQPVTVSQNQLAYILYTSGSTGEPKGVMISHRNALAFVEWARRTVDVGADDRLANHAPFHFDLSIFDIYVAALAQATLVIVPQGTSLFPAALAQWIERKQISIWYSVPSILVQLLDRGGLDRFEYRRLRKVLFAGEVFAPKYLRAWMEKVPHADWFNLYGPTETNVCTYCHLRDVPVDDTPIPIGRAASDDTIYVRRDDGRAATEADCEGEICVAGPTVALGYWADDKQTGARFVTDSELTGDDRRIYRTGDVGCWDADGNLHFRGRRDHMIKSRGYRIELGEIESAAIAHSAVLEVCAIAVPDPQIGNRIRACVVRHPGVALDRKGLLRHLVERLPHYMVPQEVCFLDALPKTSTGKTDRRALTNLTPIS